MLSEKTYLLDDLYDHERSSNVDWERDSCKLRKRYVIEYCDDKAKFERLGLIGGTEINDAYHAIHFEERNDDKYGSLDGVAWERYFFYLFNPKILDVKFYEQIYDGNGEMLQERWLALPGTFRHEAAKMINRDLMENRDTLRKQIDPLTREVADYQLFLKEMHAEDVYRNWKEAKDADGR